MKSFIVFLSLFLAASLEAQIVFLDTLTSGTDTTSGAAIRGSAAPGGQSIRAIRFTAPATPDLHLSRVEASFAAFTPASSGQTFYVTLRANNAGAPGAILAQEEFTASEVGMPAIVDVTFNAAPTFLTSSVYWLSIDAIGGSANSGLWHSPANLASRTQAFSNGGAWSVFNGQFGGAVRLTATSAIPEPSTYAALLGLAAVALGVISKRRRKA